MSVIEQQIRDKKPNGATHYDPINEEYILFEDGRFFCRFTEDNSWRQLVVEQDYLSILIPL